MGAIRQHLPHWEATEVTQSDRESLPASRGTQQMVVIIYKPGKIFVATPRVQSSILVPSDLPPPSYALSTCQMP